MSEKGTLLKPSFKLVDVYYAEKISHTHIQLHAFFIPTWQELYHAHTTADMLQSKLRAIVDCYLHSPAPPRLQLDVPVAVAEQCTKKERGPYVFREAQVRHVHVLVLVHTFIV